MRQNGGGMPDQGTHMRMHGVGFVPLTVGQLPELWIRGAAQTA